MKLFSNLLLHFLKTEDPLVNIILSAFYSRLCFILQKLLDMGNFRYCFLNIFQLHLSVLSCMVGFFAKLIHFFLNLDDLMTIKGVLSLSWLAQR
jgi:hypothetical protein